MFNPYERVPESASEPTKYSFKNSKYYLQHTQHHLESKIANYNNLSAVILNWSLRTKFYLKVKIKALQVHCIHPPPVNQWTSSDCSCLCLSGGATVEMRAGLLITVHPQDVRWNRTSHSEFFFNYGTQLWICQNKGVSLCNLLSLLQQVSIVLYGQ